MTDQAKRIISIYTEATPNPATMKFVLNKMLYAQHSIDFPSAESVEGVSPFAEELFGFPFVKAVFMANNFITITKAPDTDWVDIIPALKDFIKEYVDSEKIIIDASKLQETVGNSANEASEDDDEMVKKIKDLLKTYVEPAVAMDGGSIVFRSYDSGVVTLGMQGACSGCPSSSITLKAGIEGMMKRMIPEVREVVAESM